MTYLARLGGIVASLAFLAAVPVAAKQKPITGGAYQIDGVPGKLGQTLFNGTIRIKVSEVRNATASDHPESLLPSPSQKAMVVSATRTM